MATRTHLFHVPLGSIIRNGSGDFCVVLPSVPGKRVLEFPFRRDAAPGRPRRADTYQLTISINDQVELIKTPTQVALDVALALYDEDRAEETEKSIPFSQYAKHIMSETLEVQTDGEKA